MNYVNVGKTMEHDIELMDRVESLCKKNNRALRDILDAFPVYARRINLGKFITHYELFKKILDVPGSIIECGVFRGAGLLTWAKLIEIFSPGDRVRKVIGFDNFEGFRALDAEDGAENNEISKTEGGYNPGPYYNELVEHINIFHDDSFIPRSKRIQLVVGDIESTASEFVEENHGMRISLLNLDVDMYKPTYAALEAFYPLVAPGGIVIFDEYGLSDWPGESKAFDDYFQSIGSLPKLKTLNISSSPTAYFIKE